MKEFSTGKKIAERATWKNNKKNSANSKFIFAKKKSRKQNRGKTDLKK